jgi:hypothetical protein
MTDDKLFGKIEKSDNDGDELHQLSLGIQAFGKALQGLYDEAGSQELAALDKLKANVQQLQKTISGERTALLKGKTVELKAANDKLTEQRKRLEGIVKAINSVNEILDIATQIAQIAAGLTI